MDNILLLIGPPASGKSTWIHNYSLSSSEDFHVASTDNIIERFALENNLSYNEAFKQIDFKSAEKEMFQDFEAAIADRKDIIVDRTNMNKKSRSKFLSRVPKTYTKKAIVFDVPIDELYSRTKKRGEETGKFISPEIIDKFIASYEAPTLDEFDFIIEIPYDKKESTE